MTARPSLRTLKAAVTTLVVIAVLVAAAVSVRLTSVTTRTTTPAAVAAPSTTPTTPATVAAAGPLTPVAPVVGVPVIAVPSASVSAAAAAPTAPTTSATPPVPVSIPTTAPTPSSAAPATAQCPIKLATPATSGGLQSLIDFAPAFGPFSAEAFAAASAYQPLLQLLGPILAQYPKISAKAGPAITALLGPWETILNSVYGLLAPIYAPYRQGVLRGETKFAAFLAPYSQHLADSALGGCIVDLEAALVHDTR